MVFAALLGLVTLLLGLLIAGAIVLESRGPVLFAHTRGCKQLPNPCPCYPRLLARAKGAAAHVLRT